MKGDSSAQGNSDLHINGDLRSYSERVASSMGERFQGTNTQQRLQQSNVDISDALDVVAKARLYKEGG